MLQMKVIQKFLLALLIGYVGIVKTQAQTYELQIDSLVGIPDTIYDGQTVIFFMTVSMNTPLFYQGDMFIELEYGGNLYQVDSTVAVNQFIGPNSPNTIQAFHRFSTENDLQIGDNVVVVWPRIGDGENPLQTVLNPITTTITLAEPAGIEQHTNSRVFKPFIRPNPAIDHIQFGLHENTNVEQSILYDMTGKILGRSGTEKRLDVSGLPAGIYFLDVITRDGTVYSDKLLITR